MSWNSERGVEGMEEATDVAVSHPFCSSVISFCTGEVHGKSLESEEGAGRDHSGVLRGDSELSWDSNMK